MKKRRILLIIILIIGIIILTFSLTNNKTKKEAKNVVDVKEKQETKNNDQIEIKLNGREEITIIQNGIYEEYGARATINGKDATDKIKIKGNVDTSKVGNYKIKYYVEKAEVNRAVSVIPVTDKNVDGIPVLMYHYFYDDINGETGKSSNYMAKSIFEEQLKYLTENEYYFPSMKELKLYIDGELELPKKSVILTLDDGEESNYRIAYPLAMQYKVPLYWFVVTSWTDVTNPYQIEIKNSGYVTYLSHTDNLHHGGCGEQHGGALLCINHEEGVTDLIKSTEKLGNTDALAYPCGDVNENAMNIVKDANISLAFTTKYGKVVKGLNKLNLPRVRVNDKISLDSFINSL